MEANPQPLPDIREAIDKAVQLCGKTQTDLALALGVRQSTISHWRTRACRPTVEHALAVQRLTRKRVKVVDLRPDLADLISKG